MNSGAITDNDVGALSQNLRLSSEFDPEQEAGAMGEVLDDEAAYQ